MSEKKLIQSILNKLQEFKQVVNTSGLDTYETFVLGFICGLDSDTDRLSDQIQIIKQLANSNQCQQSENSSSKEKQSNGIHKQQEQDQREEDEDVEATPPLDDHVDNATEIFTEKKNQSSSKPNMSDSNHTHVSNNHSQASNHMNKNVLQRNDSDIDVENYMKQFESQDDEEKRTLELIKQLQEQDEETEKGRKMKMQDDDDIDCPICMCELYTENVLALETCDHVFHKECLLEYIKNKILERKALVVCPDENCKIEILVDDFKQLLGKEMYENYIKYSLESYVDEHGDEMSWCPTPDCKYVFAYDENEDESFFKCILCKKQYCLKCRVVYHDGMSCKEFEISNKRDENDLKFEKFVKGKKFKQCIKCKFWVEKNDGCDHMTCRCKYEFCYKCGGKYRECECVQKQKEQQQRLQERRLAKKQQQKQVRLPRKVAAVTAPRPARGRRANK